MSLALLAVLVLLAALVRLSHALPVAQRTSPLSRDYVMSEAREAGMLRLRLEQGGTRVRSAGERQTSELSNRMRFIAGLPMDLNTVNARDLSLLKGIGPARASLIIEARKRQGGFSRREDLAALEGLPASLLPVLNRWLALEAPAGAN